MTFMPALLDKKDYRILAALDFDARMPLSELAKKTGLSKQAADYRIKSMLKHDVIEGFYPLINSPLLGYIYCRTFLQLKSLTPQQEQELRKYILTNKRLFWAFSLGGTYDYLFVYWVRSLSEFEDVNFELAEKFGHIIMNSTQNVITNVIHMSHKCLADKTEPVRFDLCEQRKTIDLDETDRKILSSLALDARQSLVEISKKCNVAPKVVAYRIKKLEAGKVIAGYRPIINYEKIGLTYFKVFLNISQCSHKEFSKLQSHLLSHPKVIYLVHGISMPADFDIELLAESSTDFFDFMKELKNIFPSLITDYQYLIYTKTLKVNYAPFY